MEKQHLITQIQTTATKWELLELLNDIKTDLAGSDAYPFSLKAMMRLCNPQLDRGRYRKFTIPKKSGGVREIYAPNGNLKWIQLCLNEIFKAVYTPSPYAMGFAEGRSVVDNASKHLHQNYVFNIDLADFFPSIDQARVWKRLQLAPFNFTKKVANIVAGLCSIKSKRKATNETYEDCYCLPQGAPTSPILTNAICDTLDRRLAGLAKRFGLRYSRYADDITFSSMHNVYQEGSDFRVELERIIVEQKFSINNKKTRLHHRSKRQEVTGLTVGEKINVTRKYVKDIRAILHIWERHGLNAAYANFYPRYKADKGHLHKGEPNIENVISGKLCYLKMIKGDTDPVYMRLQNQFDRLTTTPPTNESTQCSWEYIQTYDIADFEKKFNTKVEWTTSKKGNHYAYFILNGEKIMVYISRNVSMSQSFMDYQISLCCHKDFKLSLCRDYYVREEEVNNPKPTTAYGRMVLGVPLPEDIGTRYMYLIHRPLSPNKPRKIVLLRKDVEGLDESGNINVEKQENQILKTNNKDILTQLIESDFDLSILP